MADSHFTRERSAWVLARAGRNPAARRRGEQLAARARRSARYEAGAGDAAIGEVVTPNRIHRTVYKGDDHRAARVLWVGARETARALLAGPGIGLSWLIYASWYRRVPSWGPLRWRPAAVVAAIVPILLLIVTAVAWWRGGIPWWGWYAICQVQTAALRLAWLIRAYGWEAVPARNAPVTAPIKVRLGGEAPLPTTTPVTPATTVTVHVPLDNRQSTDQEDIG